MGPEPIWFTLFPIGPKNSPEGWNRRSSPVPYWLDAGMGTGFPLWEAAENACECTARGAWTGAMIQGKWRGRREKCEPHGWRRL
jgi:hypothetical protein